MGSVQLVQGWDPLIGAEFGHDVSDGFRLFCKTGLVALAPSASLYPDCVPDVLNRERCQTKLTLQIHAVGSEHTPDGIHGAVEVAVGQLYPPMHAATADVVEGEEELWVLLIRRLREVPSQD